ncbi:MAG: SoxR reducing system RseC family protein [Sphaerochaetaceae bacterium]|jgi:sigma-E factor negative regulatory protein RseC|nr:SoxR reducing system RseC family protein [Sphaerochaetaceae bacterium]MDD3941069.1 SoxR reducing system RseC family protein [Sphaerochaetaceae bacterium]MDX9939075.1 SoxR reducing system RseC family protein [Sphaerochaetaceae bacterium]
MYEHASVVSIQPDGKITVACQTSGCESCKAGAFCGTKGKTFVARNSAKTELSIGDTVELYLPPGRTILAGFIALLVPILLFPVGYYIPALVVPETSELFRVLTGIGGIAVGFLISRLFSRLKADEYTPQITRIIGREES